MQPDGLGPCVRGDGDRPGNRDDAAAGNPLGFQSTVSTGGVSARSRSMRGEDGRLIENDAFTGAPTIRVTRMVEEGNVVVAEGTVHSTRKDGGTLNLVFCDVFVMRDAKIRHLTSYLMELKAGE